MLLLLLLLLRRLLDQIASTQRSQKSSAHYGELRATTILQRLEAPDERLSVPSMCSIFLPPALLRIAMMEGRAVLCHGATETRHCGVGYSCSDS